LSFLQNRQQSLRVRLLRGKTVAAIHWLKDRPKPQCTENVAANLHGLVGQHGQRVFFRQFINQFTNAVIKPRMCQRMIAIVLQKELDRRFI